MYNILYHLLYFYTNFLKTSEFIQIDNLLLKVNIHSINDLLALLD